MHGNRAMNNKWGQILISGVRYDFFFYCSRAGSHVWEYREDICVVIVPWLLPCNQIRVTESNSMKEKFYLTPLVFKSVNLILYEI
jgi:hypothetical protein